MGWLNAWGLLPLMLCAACAAAPLKVQEPPEPAPTAVASDGEKTSSDAQIATSPVPLDLIAVSATPERSVIEADAASDMIVQLRLTASEVANTTRPPINLGLVVDTSGSMAGDAIESARHACQEVLRMLHVGDQLSIVAFGSRAEVLVPSTVLTSDKAPLAAQIAKMKAEGTTDMGAGLQQGLAEVQRRMLAKGINRIVLLGDGVPNDANAVQNIAAQAARVGVSVTTFGLGIEYDETLMSRIAQTTGGTFHFIDDPSKVAGVFEREVTRLERIVARAGWFELSPGPGVTIRTVLGMAGSWAGRSFRVQVGDLAEGQTRDVMVHVSLAGHREGATVEMFDVTFRYSDPIHDVAQREVHQFVSLRASKDASALAEGRHPEVEHKGTRFRVADMIVNAIANARSGNVPHARQLLKDAEKLAKEGAVRFSDQELAAKAKEVRILIESVASLAPQPQRPHHPLGAGMGRGTSAPAPMSAPAARGVRRAHGDATRTLNDM